MFFKVLLFSLFLISLFSLNAVAQELVWSDEFDGNSIDMSKWDKPEYNRRKNDNGPDGWWLRQDSFLDGQGHLIIRARKINNRNSDNDPFDYATGAIRSFGKFEQKFGKFEIRCKLPNQPGWWVAFWLYSTSVGNVNGSGEDGTEIDIFEGFGWTDKMQHALHWDGYGDAHQSIGQSRTMEGLSEGFHTFSLEWYENMYIFYIDGMESWRTDAGGVSKVPAYVKITGELSTVPWAIGTGWANDPEKATYPDSFVVDYVRVYELDETVNTKPDPKDHLAYRKSASASSQSSTRYQARRAVDANIATLWKSETGTPQWLSVDLGDVYAVNQVTLSWGENFGTDYKIQVAENSDGPWMDCVHITDNADRGTVTHEFSPQAGQHVRMYGIESSRDGFALHEMAVYGEPSSEIEESKVQPEIVPSELKLYANYPNPFNASTRIRYATLGGHVRLSVHNLSGQRVAYLLDEVQAAGERSVAWDVGNLTSGVYLARLQVGGALAFHKLVVQK